MKNSSKILSVMAISAAFTMLPNAFAQELSAPCPEAEMLDALDNVIAAGPDGRPPFAPPMPELSIESNGSAPMAFMAHLPGRCSAGDMMFGGLSGDLSLSDDQLEKIFQVKEDHMNKVGSKLAELFTQMRILKATLTLPETDRSKLEATQSKINSLRSDIANLRLQKQIDTLEVLTKEQRKELRRNFVKRADFGPNCPMMMGRWKHHGKGQGPAGNCK